MNDFIYGGLSGLCEVSVSHPIDLLKTQIQESHSKNKISKISIKQIYNTTGIYGLYSGYLPRMCGVFPMRLLFWGSQSKANELIKSSNYKSLVVGSITGSVQTLVDSPIEYMKVKTMTGGNYKNLCLTRGFIPTLFRNVGFAGILFTCIDKYPYQHKYDSYVKAGIGGFVGSVLTQPFDYVKTVLQSNNSQNVKMSNVIKTTFKTPYKFMSGTLPRASIGFINMGVGYSCFVFFKNLSNSV